MTTRLENGGTVALWAGWSVTLPPACHETNADGSWSAWGADWTLDVHIVEVGGKANGDPASAEEMLGERRAIDVEGNGWIGSVEFLREIDDGKAVYRLAANLAATNTSLSCWIAYVEPNRQAFAEGLLRSVVHAS